MANYLTWSGLDEVYREMQREGETVGETAQKMLEVGGQECVKAWKLAIGMHGDSGEGISGRATGEMMNAVGIKFKKIKMNGMRTAEIYPLGKNKRGVRYAMIAFILHYGRSNMKGDRFVDDAERIAEEEAVPAMINIWEQSK